MFSRIDIINNFTTVDIYALLAAEENDKRYDINEIEVYMIIT
ncbi:MAG: hypothetical protein QW416_06995 [Candidatus Nitrosocaldaceae archaeon]